MLIVWQATAPAETPVDQLLDARTTLGALLLCSALIAGIARWVLSHPSGAGPRRRRGAWLVATGAAMAYGGVVVAITPTDTEFSVAAGVALIVIGLLVMVVATLWWNSARALAAVLAGAWVATVPSFVYDIGWQLSGPRVEPFTPCIGGMDCIGQDPETPAASAWVAFGAVWGSLWVGGALLLLLLLSFTVRVVWQGQAPRPARD